LTPNLRLALTAGIRKVFFESPEGNSIRRKYLGPARARVKELVRHKVKKSSAAPATPSTEPPFPNESPRGGTPVPPRSLRFFAASKHCSRA